MTNFWWKNAAGSRTKKLWMIYIRFGSTSDKVQLH